MFVFKMFIVENHVGATGFEPVTSFL